jgi:geranylgeranyl diphosphate synthase type II
MGRMSAEIDERQFAEAIEADRHRIEARLETLVGHFDAGPDGIREAVRYVLLDSGKRIRPLLCLWTHDSLHGSERDACLDVACAIECLHTYSLVHDDLPCMDDDDLRRGKPSCHKAFGEAIAVLTGDALLTFTFEVLIALRERNTINETIILDIMRVVSGAAGTGGLITGQALDLAEGLTPSIETVERIHRHKTAALIAAAMETGAVVAGASDDARSRVRLAGGQAGEAFQIIDDLLDLDTDRETLGKTPGKDVKAGKLTYPSVVGEEASRERAEGLIAEARRGLADAGDTSRLAMLLDFIVSRKR